MQCEMWFYHIFCAVVTIRSCKNLVLCISYLPTLYCLIVGGRRKSLITNEGYWNLFRAPKEGGSFLGQTHTKVVFIKAKWMIKFVQKWNYPAAHLRLGTEEYPVGCFPFVAFMVFISFHTGQNLKNQTFIRCFMNT